MKIVFIGAGSFTFTRQLVNDILTFPLLRDSTITLMDVDREKLHYIFRAVKRIVAEGGHPAKVEATEDRREALKKAEAVICTILSGGVDVWRHDIEIPKKYGVDVSVGDTRGPSGIFRALRTIPVMLSICRDMEELCPKAILLNYTNPMAMLCRAMQQQSALQVTGLCHSVQGTAFMLAEWIGASREEISYVCAGINHMAFYLRFLWKDKDAYPLIREAVKKPEFYRQEVVRNEIFLHLGYYVTESSAHSSEYNWWFRKRQDLIERYCHQGGGENPGYYGYTLKRYLSLQKSWREEIQSWLDNEKPLDLQRGEEYASCILNAWAGGEPYKFNGNVANTGLIPNLAHNACVEVPVYADRQGFHPIYVGSLPPQCAALVGHTVNVEEMAVQGCLSGDPNLVFQAVCYDPLTAAVLSLAEIREMVNEMFELNRENLPSFKHFKV